MTKCSELFEDAFNSDCAGCIRDCCCGRTFFNGDGDWSWEDGELELLRQKAKDNPDQYLEHDYPIGTMIIDGKEIVYNCECDTARKYEDFILAHASQIAKYLNKMASEHRRIADQIEVKKVI